MIVIDTGAGGDDKAPIIWCASSRPKASHWIIMFVVEKTECRSSLWARRTYNRE